MKIYISGAISNTDDFMERFAKAEKELTDKGWSVVNPAKVNAQLPEDTSYEEYMKMSFCMLDMCDGIYMLKGWKKSWGANRELGYAMAKNMIIMYEQERANERQIFIPCKAD